MINVTTEQRQILNLLGHNLFSAPLEILPDVDWDLVARESMAQTVFITTFYNYREYLLSPEFASKVQAALRKQMLYNAECFKKYNYLHELMMKHHIPYCVVKGVVSAMYYPDEILRSMGDVDFYVASHEIDRALRVFLDDGFSYDDHHDVHLVLKGKNGYFEMHFKPVSYCEEHGEIFLRAWEDILETADTARADVATFVRPSVFHHGFILLTHLHAHLSSSGVGLRHLVDWAVFANSLSETQFREIFEQRFKAYGLWRFAQLLSLAAVRHMGMPYQSWMGEDGDTADELLLDILRGGNFGRKDKQRKYEGLFISGGTRIPRKNRVKNVFRSMNHIVDNNWKAAKKCPLLYPVGWVVFTLRFLFRVLVGKRRVNVVSSFKKGGERTRLYERIKIFEPEE